MDLPTVVRHAPPQPVRLALVCRRSDADHRHLSAGRAGCRPRVRWPLRERPRPNAAIVLVLMAANYGVRAVAHERALTLAPQVFGARLPARCDASARSHPIVNRWPRPVSPLTGKRDAGFVPRGRSRRCRRSPRRSTGAWSRSCRMGTKYSDVNVLASRVRVFSAGHRMPRRASRGGFPNQWTPPCSRPHGPTSDGCFSVFRDSPRRGPSLTPTESRRCAGTRCALRAEKPARIGQDRGTSFFTATVRIDRDGRILDERLGR